MTLMLKGKKDVLKCFYDNTIKIFSYLNIVVILAPGREFFSAKCAQLSLTFTESN